ncbi:MAG: ABC transporter substrate-binding protein [Ilumatobacteraceae bacterium]
MTTSGFDRRRFLRLSGLGVGTAIVAPSILSACGGSSSTSNAPSLPIGTPDRPITLPVTRESIADGLAPESGTLRVYNYADYVNPDVVAAFEETYGVTVEISTYVTEEEAVAKLRSGSVEADVILGMTDTSLALLVAADLIQPINRSYLTNFSNVITGLQNPYYDVGSQYTVPHVIYANGIGYRTDRDVDTSSFSGDDGWNVLWDSTYSGRVGVLDSYRDTINMALFRNGVFDVNTGDAELIDRAVSALNEMSAATRPQVDILSYQEIPAGNRDIGLCWSGDMLAGIGYLPEDGDPMSLGFWYPKNTITANDFFAVGSAATHPVLAHHFVDYLLDVDNALANQVFVGYQPALEPITTDLLIDRGVIPDSLVDALVTPTRYDDGLRLVTLEPAVDTLWIDAWTTFTSG